MSNWGDDNKKDYFNFYPLIDSVMYDNQIMSLKNGNYNGYQFKFFSSDMKFNDWYLVGEQRVCKFMLILKNELVLYNKGSA